MADKLPEYKIFAISMRPVMRGEPTISSVAIRTTVRCRWTTLPGSSSVRIGFSWSTPVSPRMSATRRGRKFLRCPIDSLKLLDIDPDAVTDCVITHLHYDHVGNFSKLAECAFPYPGARDGFRDRPLVRYGYFGHGFEEEDVVGMVRLNFKRRLEMYDGDVELAPGFTLHFAPGHTAGLQVARVHTQRGYVVLASDSSHYYENIQKNRPFIAVVNIADTIRLLS